EVGNLLVVGEPGAGKSGALHEFVRVAQRRGRDAVFFAVDHLQIQNLQDLSVGTGLSQNIVDVLAAWGGRDPGFVVIDALDAARGETAANVIRMLIELIGARAPRWRVVASIRKFDLRYSRQLQELFRGQATSPLRDSEFNRIRHVNVPPLTSEELEQLGQ